MSVDTAAEINDGCMVTTLESLCEKMNFVPDLIKMDIESWEYEVINDSLEFLYEHSPSIHLEIHTKQLAERGISASDLVASLKKVGYRVVDSDSRKWTKQNAHLRLEKKI
jgi:hypothetical protein